MKRFAGIAAALLLTISTVQAAYAADAKAFVDSVAKQVLEVVKTDASPLDKQHKLEGIFSDKVDLNFIGKFVLGKHWREASPAQQTSYMAAYKPFILKNYASKLTKYSGQTYDLKNPRDDGEASVVTMVIHDTNGSDVNVDYRVQNSKIVDIVVEGVSLLTTQRSEFNSIVENKGIDGLIDALKKQVAAKG